MIKILLGVAFGIVFGFKYGVTKVEIAGYTRTQLTEMKDACERLQPRTIHCVATVRFKAVGVPTGGRNVPRLKSYDSSLDTDVTFEEPVTQLPKVETYEFKPSEADPILKQSWEEAKTPEGLSVHIPPPEQRITGQFQKVKN